MAKAIMQNLQCRWSFVVASIVYYMVLDYFHGIFYSKVCNYVSNNFYYEENGRLLIETRGKNLCMVVSVKNTSLKSDS